MNRNPDYEPVVPRGANYEAGFTRAANYDEVTPEELVQQVRRKSLIFKCFVAALFVIAISAAASLTVWMRRDTPQKQVERGIAYSAANSHTAAIIEFKRSLQEDPDQPAVRLLLGSELEMLGDANNAEIEFRKAADSKYRPEKTFPLLGTALLHQAKFDKVIAFVNSVSIESPEANAELLTLRGSAYYALGREFEAEASWQAARDYLPGNPMTVLAESRALASKGLFEDAGGVLDTIAANTPTAEVLALRGELARATGKPLEAVSFYESAIKLEPGNLFVRENLAQTFVDLSRFDEAAAQIRPVVLRKPKYANARYVEALAKIGKKDYQGANDSISAAVHLMPTDGRYQLLAGKLSLQLGRPVEAEQHLRDAVTLIPRSADARRLLAMIYLGRNEGKKAGDLFEPVFEANRQDPEIAMIAARIAVLQHDTARAARAFDQIDPAAPKNVEANLMAASLKIKVGAKADGFARLKAASAASPDDPNIDAAFVISHLTFGEIREAAAAWNLLAQKERNSARTYNLLAAIDLARKDKPAARRAMLQAIDTDSKYLAPVSGLAMLDLSDKKPDDAKARLRDFVAKNPTDVDAAMLSIELERSYGNRQDVIVGLLQDALKANPTSGRVTYALVAYYANQGDPTQALSVAEKGLTVEPEDVNLLRFVGGNALAVGDNDRAIALFTKLMEQDSTSPDYPIHLGLGLLARGRSEEALTAFRLGLSRDPYNQDRQLMLVATLLSAGKADEAARMLFDISRLAPKSPVIPELEADVKMGLKQYPEAIAAYKRTLGQRPSSRLAIKTFNGLTTARLRGEASLFLADWIKTHPNDEQVRLFAGELAMRNKDYQRAIAVFRSLVPAHSNDALLLNNLAWCLSRIDDPQALSMAEKAAGLAPTNPAISDTLGWILVERGDAVRGLTLLEKAHRAAPNELQIRLHLANAQLKTGKNDAARATLQSVVAAAPESEEGKASRALLSTF